MEKKPRWYSLDLDLSLPQIIFRKFFFSSCLIHAKPFEAYVFILDLWHNSLLTKNLKIKLTDRPSKVHRPSNSRPHIWMVWEGSAQFFSVLLEFWNFNPANQ